MVMSLRQIGVPLGGVCAALILPPLVPFLGWRGALALELIPMVALIFLMEIPRRTWDRDREPARPAFGRTLLQPFLLLADGRSVKGFICEPWALADALDITEFGGWRAFIASRG